MNEHNANVYNRLMKLCPEMLKPFAEMMLPNAIEQMDEQQKLDLEEKLVSHENADSEDTAIMLIEFAKALGADPAMFDMAKMMQPDLDMPEELKALL